MARKHSGALLSVRMVGTVRVPAPYARIRTTRTSAGALIDWCLAENDRRMGGYDARLLRPTLVPKLARIVRRFIS